MCGTGDEDKGGSKRLRDDPSDDRSDRKPSTTAESKAKKPARRVTPTFVKNAEAKVKSQPPQDLSTIWGCAFSAPLAFPEISLSDTEQRKADELAKFLEAKYAFGPEEKEIEAELKGMEPEFQTLVKEGLAEYKSEELPDIEPVAPPKDDDEPPWYLDELAEERDDQETELPALSLDFLDVGMGSSTLIVCADGTTVLIDCGDHKSGSAVPAKDALTYLKRRLLELQEIRELPKPKIDRIYITHPDQDHYNLLPSFFHMMGDDFEVDEFHIGGKQAQYKVVRDVFDVDKGKKKKKKNEKELPTMDEIFERGEVTEYDKDFEGENAPSLISEEVEPGTKISFQILGANAVPLHGETKTNAASLVILVEKAPASEDGKPFKVLMMGDGEQTVEENLMERHKDKIEKVDLLHVGHHGAELAATEPFLKVTNPRVAQISADQVWAHPYRSTVERITKNKDLRVNEAMEGDKSRAIIVGEGRGRSKKEHMEETTRSALLMNVVKQKEDTSGSEKAEAAKESGDTPMEVTGQQWRVNIRRDNSISLASTLDDQNDDVEFL